MKMKPYYFNLCIFLFTLTISSNAVSGNQCPPLPYVSLPNGKITFVETGKFRFQCENGFFLSGPRQIKCKNGNWTSTTIPTCFKGEGLCEPLVKIPNADIFGEDVMIGSVVQYICHPGFIILGDGQRICLQTGFWSGITPSCLNQSESLKDVALRLEKQFVTKMRSFSNSKVQARYLDEDSLLNGLELVILVDRSSSVDPVDLEKAKHFLKFIFDKFKVNNGNPYGTRVAVIAFGTEVQIIFNVNNATINNPGTASQVLNQQLQPGGGGTAMNPALIAVLHNVVHLLRSDAKRVLFLMSDGEPNIGGSDVDEVADALKNIDNFEIFAIGIGQDINRQTLSSVVSEPIIDHVFLLENYKNLEDILNIMKNKPQEVPPPSPHKCGHLHPKNKWPWNAGIFVAKTNVTNGTTNLKLCGGALICSEWVISAASCFYSKNENDTYALMESERIAIVLGEKNLIVTDSDEMSFYAKNIIVHPKFNMSMNLYYNLALIQLNEPAPVKKFRPICLPPTSKTIPLHLVHNLNASIRAWGFAAPKSDNENVYPGNTRFASYKEKSVILTSGSECRQSAGKKVEGKSIFCASTGSQTCLGNIGTPIMAEDPQSKIQHVIGILSQRNNCAKGFSQYTELTKYVKWINDVTNKCHFKHWNGN